MFSETFYPRFFLLITVLANLMFIVVPVRRVFRKPSKLLIFINTTTVSSFNYINLLDDLL